MKKSSPALPGILSPCGHLLTDIQFIAQIADLMHDTAFFIKEAEGRYRVVNRSILEWHGLADKSQMRGQRHCGICPGDYGRIPTEQDCEVLGTDRPIVEQPELFWRKPNMPVSGLTSKFPVRDAIGRITGLMGISK